MPSPSPSPSLGSCLFAGTISIVSALILLVSSVTILDVVHGFSVGKTVIDSPLLSQRIGSSVAIIVDPNGNGDFKTIQAAIDAVPEGNSEWITIHVTEGIYREKVHVPRDKPHIFMKGDGKGKTIITWSETSAQYYNYKTATFVAEAPDFIAFGMSIKNEAPLGVVSSLRNQTVAALVAGDKIAFYQCAFFSTYNTLFDYKGRHYYESCYIQGSLDFIFGHGQSLFQNCEIFVNGNRMSKIHGSVTAHSRPSADAHSGFVFVNGRIYGVGDVYLGRPQGAFSRVVFANTYLSKAIAPQGWTNWSHDGRIEDVYHAEYKCHGPGAVSSNRALWSKQLGDSEAEPFLSIDYINGKRWLPAYM